ncbi:FAD-dependent monooxygenase [Amycolatopsis sp. NPDC051106]|uniref:FAD-dependent monooxygenase n=1 Tax=unclassified Amycolatopsis TaxID=2618356 RepID=UPI00343E99A0
MNDAKELGEPVTSSDPLGEPNQDRLSYGDRLNRPADLRAEVPEEEVRTAVRERFGEEAEINEIRWNPRFPDDSRLAARYRVGRVLLAGIPEVQRSCISSWATASPATRSTVESSSC